MEIGEKDVEQTITLDASLDFVASQDVADDTPTTAAYTITGPEGYVLGIDAGTPVAFEFRDSTGAKLDESTRVIVQKCDKQGNPLGDGIIFNDLLGRFNFEKMRNDPDYFRKTQKGLMLDEREIVKIFVDIPSGSTHFSASDSVLTIGDDTSDFGKPVEIVDHDDLTSAESQAVKAASQRGGR